MYICGEKYCIMFNANKLFVYLTRVVILLLFVVVVVVIVLFCFLLLFGFCGGCGNNKRYTFESCLKCLKTRTNQTYQRKCLKALQAGLNCHCSLEEG